MSDEKKKRRIKPKAIVLDYDDTIVDFLGGLCNIHNKRYNTCVTPSDLTDWNFSSLEFEDARKNKVKGEELRATFKEYEPEGLYVGLDILGDADFALELIKELGYRIIVLTARPDVYGKQTELNLIKNRIDRFIDEIYFKPEDFPEIENFKVKRIKELSKNYNIQVFADDKGETVQQVFENCNVNFCFLVEKRHNREFTIEDEQIIRVKDIMEIVRYLKKIKA